MRFKNYFKDWTSSERTQSTLDLRMLRNWMENHDVTVRPELMKKFLIIFNGLKWNPKWGCISRKNKS